MSASLRHGGAKLLIGLAIAFAAFQWSASSLGSDRGQAGMVVGTLVVAVTLCLQRLFFAPTLPSAARSIGLGWPAWRGVLAALVLGATLLCIVPVFAKVTASSIALQPGWASMLAGLFAQASVAEETLFRGYLFANLRQRHDFWRAAGLSMIPFVAVHLFLFASLPWPIAAAALALSVVVSFPMAYLFELGGATIWAPALLHFVVQGSVKLLVVTGPASESLPIVWMAGCAALPYLVFIVPRTAPRGHS
jgi:membrane protease YdiL (CAAX protease family)